EAVKLVEHNVALGVALELDHHAISIAVGLVAQVGDAVDLLVAHQFGDALDHGRLVHLVGNFSDDDRFAFLAYSLERNFAAHDDRAAANGVRATDAGTAENDAAGRKVGTGDDRVQVFDAERRVV